MLEIGHFVGGCQFGHFGLGGGDDAGGSAGSVGGLNVSQMRCIIVDQEY
jgi:hypothetical protein